MKSLTELIFVLCITMYFFGFPVDINTLLDKKVGTSVAADCPKEAPKAPKKDDTGPVPGL
jgi:hypothetical protein